MSQLIGYILIFCLSILSGVTAQQYRIVNGTDAAPEEFPFIVSLRRTSGGRHSCGASLINRSWVLTAAHCVTSVLPTMINIQYGSNELNANSTNIANISKIFVHKGYAPRKKYEHDIALLKLREPITFSDAVHAVQLPEMQQFTPGNTTAILLGWGLNSTGGVVQKHLQMVTLQTFTDEECSLLHEIPMHVTTICAGIPDGGKGQCSGGSGGPLLVNNTQVGIVSWSRKPCTVPPYPGVLTEVSAYVDWIAQTIDDEAELEDNYYTNNIKESLQSIVTGNMRRITPLCLDSNDV